MQMSCRVVPQRDSSITEQLKVQNVVLLMGFLKSLDVYIINII